MVQQSFNSFPTAESAISSLGASIRFCRPDSRLHWHLQAAFDRVESRGQVNTAGRLGGGIFYLLDPADGGDGPDSTFGMGVTALAGYEEFDISTFDAAGNPLPLRGSRVAKSISVRAEYVRQGGREPGGFPAPLDALRIGASAAYVDKRSPGSGVPDFLTEGFALAEAHLSFEHFVDHHPFGSRIDFQLQYERFFTDPLRVNGIATLGLRWRPQSHPDIDNPDRFVLGLAYRVGDGGFSGWLMSLGKAF